MAFRRAASIDANQHKGLILLNSISGQPLVATGLSLTNAQPIHVAIVDGSGTQVTSFGGTGGTSSSFGSAFPSTGTAAGAIDSGGNMAGLNLDASGNLKVSGSLSVGGTVDNSAFTAGTTTGTPTMGFYHSTIDTVTDGRAAAVGITNKRAMLVTLQTSSGADTGVAAIPLQVSLANTAANATAVKVDGSAVTQPVSLTSTTITGTVAVTQSTSPWVVSNGGTFAVQAAQSGTWNITNISGTVSLPTGASTETTLAKLTQTQGSTTSGQSGPLIQGAVTTGAPSYTTAQTSPLSLDTSGNLRTTTVLGAGSAVIGHVITDSGSTTGVTGTVTVSGTVTTTPPSNASTNIAQINGVTPLMGNGVTGTGSQRVTIASDNTAFPVNATLSAETTKVIGVTRTADGAGNLLTTNSTTYTAKFGLDGNLLGTLGTAFSTAGKVDVKGADGDVFVRQTTGTNLHTVIDSGTLTAVTAITNALPAGTNLLGKVGIDQTTPGTTNAVSANQGTAAALAAGWVIINGEQADTTGTFTNATQTTSVTASNLAGYGNVLISINGTFGTATAIFEGSDDGGTTWYTINEASRTDSSTVENGYTSLTNTTRAWQTNNPGWDSLRVRSTAVASGTVNVRISPSAAPSAAGATVTLGAALPSGANVIGHTITDTGSTTAVTGNVAVTQSTSPWIVSGGGTAGSAATGVVTIQGIASMTKLLVTPDSVALPANQSVNISQINAVTPLMGNGVTGTGSQRVTIASDNTAFTVNATQATAASLNATVVGTGTFSVQTTSDTPGTGAANLGKAEDAASASGDTGVMALAVRNDSLTAAQTNTNGDYGALSVDTSGILITAGAPRALKGRQVTTITSSTAETTILTSIASTFLDIYGLVLTNTSATVTKVSIRDATAGGTISVFEVPPTDTRGFMLPLDSAIPQAAVTNNWTAQCGTSVASLEVTVLYVKRV